MPTGITFGKILAPKDVERLIDAISQSEVKRPLAQGDFFSALKAADDSIKSLAELKRTLEELRVNKQLKPQEIEQLCSLLLSSAEKGGLKLDENQSVYYWVWSLAHEKDSSAGGDNFGKIHAPKDIERLIQAISQSEAKRPLAEANLVSAPKVKDNPIKSLAELKRLLEELRVNKQLNAQEIEQLCSQLLSSAEKGGLKLDENQSVYYWVWSLAHEKDSSAGGDNFGKIHAPKDIERLIQAISQSESKRPLAEGNLVSAPKVMDIPIKPLAEGNFPSALKAADNPIKSLAELKRSLKELRVNKQLKPQEIEQLCSLLLSSAEKGGLKLDENQSVYYWVWSLAHEKDSSAGGDNFGKIHAPKDIERLIKAISQSEVRRPLAEGNFASARKAADDPIKSLTELKRLLEQLRDNKQLKPQEIEQLCSLLLSSAEKGGLKLDQSQGVYYRVWFLAHEKDSSAGGDNFGKIQAPKDINRLIEAVARSKGL